MKLKKVANHEFFADEVFDGIRDAFGKKCKLLVSHTMNEIRIVGENSTYKRKEKMYTDMNLHNIVIPKYLDVIDLDRSIANEITSMYPDYRHTAWNLW